MSLKRPSIKLSFGILSFGMAFAALVGLSTTAQAQDEKPARHGMMKMDTDGDGSVSRDEFLAHHKSRYAKMDTDGDGVISDEEKAAAKEARKAKREEHRAKMKERRKQHHEKMMTRYDANKDGKLDASEREAMASDHFAKMDKNGDGVLSADELPRRRHGHHGHHGQKQ